jgi:hypothetical protein
MNDKQRSLLSLVIMAVAEFQGKLIEVRQIDKAYERDMYELFEALRQIKTYLAFFEKSNV